MTAVPDERMSSGSPTYEDLLYEVADGVATVTINRPQRRNAMRGQTLEELTDALNVAARDDAVGVVVVTGAGGHFCGGGDLNMVPGPDGSVNIEPPPVEVALHWLQAFRLCPKPVIGRVQGSCIGMGNELNLLCDLTIAGESAQFGQAGPRVGSVPMVGGTQLLPLVAGLKRAKEILYLCRRYSGQAAVDMGLANIVVPDDLLDAEVARWADELLDKSPQSLRMAKTALSTLFDLQWPALQHGLELNGWMVRSAEMQEGATAFVEKRRPDFRPGIDR